MLPERVALTAEQRIVFDRIKNAIDEEIKKQSKEGEARKKAVLKYDARELLIHCEVVIELAWHYEEQGWKFHVRQPMKYCRIVINDELVEIGYELVFTFTPK